MAEPAMSGTVPSGDGTVRVLIDTDAANEIDDQFAIAWALLAPDRLRIDAITAAPYCHGSYFDALTCAPGHRGERPSTPFEELAAAFGPAEAAAMTQRHPPRVGMERSLDEIERIVDLAEPSHRPTVVPGAERFMAAPDDLVESPAARTIVELAHANASTLHIAVMGAPTNVAAALLIDPSIASKIEVVFVAGHPSDSRHVDDSFNLVQDRHATNRLFAPDVDLTSPPSPG